MAEILRSIARRRVLLGFIAAPVTLILAQPTWETWRVGLFIAAAGEIIRVWAAGHLEKNRELTGSGPYRWTGHPLYVGSWLVALGVVIASRSGGVATLAITYMVITTTAAIRTEEAFLRQRFGEVYDRYQQSCEEPMQRRFSVTRVMHNREHRAIAGFGAGFALLALKILAPL